MTSNQQDKKITLKILGTHCASCEILIERKFKEIPGVTSVNVHYGNGKTIVHADRDIKLDVFSRKIADSGYNVAYWYEGEAENIRKQELRAQTEEANGRKWKEVAGAIIIFFGLYFLLKTLNLIPDSIGVSENMSLGAVLVIGLIASTSSCLAVTGGLLISIAAKHSAVHPEMTGVQKFKPHLFFNAGRLTGYAFFGAIVGAIGSALTISPAITGWLNIAAAGLMILLGLQSLEIFPALNKIKFGMPKWVGHRIHDANEQKNAAPFLMGALTFFLPCGFTQALQLYVLSKGLWLQGGLTMFIFALGTVPALMSLGAISSFAKGNTQRYFLKFSGVLVIVLGLVSFKSGYVLAGIPYPSIEFTSDAETASPATPVSGPAVTLQDGRQIVRMKVKGYDYEPANFTVKAGVPVEWHIDASKAAGCAHSLIMSGMGIQQILNGTDTVISFTPAKPGFLPFSCSMGMTTPGAGFQVASN